MTNKTKVLKLCPQEITFIAKTNFGKITEVKGKFGWTVDQASRL